MRYLTAGESHGEALCGILEGVPAGLELDANKINAELKRRQSGYGRGARMRIESDTAHFFAGVRGGKTTGAPIAFLIENRDFENWTDVMSPFGAVSDRRAVTKVRPGHADFVGCIKYGFDDARNVLERASARETAARTVIGAICKQLLQRLGILIGSHVVSIGDVPNANAHTVYSAAELIENADKNEVRCMNEEAAERMKKRIDRAKKDGDSLGGKIEVVISGVPAGIGSYVQGDRRLDGILAGACMSVQAIKAVEIGRYADGAIAGTDAPDAVYPNGESYKRENNRACGIEGGMSNGEDICIRAVMKPIPTTARGVDTVDIKTGKAARSENERSDVCAVPAAAVVLENAAAFALADEILKTVGGDTAIEAERAVKLLREKAVSTVRGV